MATGEISSNARPVKLTESESEITPQTPTQRVIRRFVKHRAAMVGLVVLIGMIVYIIGGSFIFTEAYANRNDTKIRLQAPSAEHPFGTDRIGRDILARTIYGGQISLMIGLLAVIVEVTLGTTIGAVAGYYGGWIDSILMRFTEAMLSIPSLLLLLVMAKFFGSKIPDIPLFGRTFSGSVIVIILIIGLTSWMGLARIVRSNVLSLKETEFILAARALGLTNRRIIMAHILPNTLASIIVALTLGVAGAILQEAYVSFLGLGVQTPTASWGNILTEAQEFQIIKDAPWYWFFPSLLILLTVLSINFVGDGLRDALDPRSDKKV
ncbi:MAG: ABC transporter permease [Anaerolineae bacterium]|nr:ABC transporter permease [Anaerolineae bacterium]